MKVSGDHVCSWGKNAFKVSSFVFHVIKKVIQVWKYMRVGKWWQKFHFWANYPFKMALRRFLSCLLYKLWQWYFAFYVLIPLCVFEQVWNIQWWVVRMGGVSVFTSQHKFSGLIPELLGVSHVWDCSVESRLPSVETSVVEGPVTFPFVGSVSSSDWDCHQVWSFMRLRE